MCCCRLLSLPLMNTLFSHTLVPSTPVQLPSAGVRRSVW